MDYNSLFKEVDNMVPNENNYSSLFAEIDGTNGLVGFSLPTKPAPTQDFSQGSTPLGTSTFMPGSNIANPRAISTDSANKPTVNIDGTISTLTTGQPEDKKGAFNKNVAQELASKLGQTVAGMRKMPIGISILGSDAVDKIFNTNFAKAPKESAKKINSYIENYNKAHPNELVHPSTVGELADYSFMPFTGAVLTDATLLGAGAFLEGLGNNKSYDQAAIEGVSNMALSLVPLGVLKKLFPKAEGLSKEAKIFLDLNRGRTTPEEALKLLRDIPKQDQVLTLAERTELGKNYIKGALRDDNALMTRYGERLESSKNVLDQLKSTELDLAKAEDSYSAMRATVDKEAPQLIKLKFHPDGLDSIIKIYKTDVSGVGTVLKSIKSDLNAENLRVSDLIDIRENLNSIMSKPAIKKMGRSMENLYKLKNVLDAQIAATLKDSPKLLKTINNTIHDFGVTKTNHEFGKLLDKHTKSEYAVDFKSLLKDIQDKGLYSENMQKYAMPILKEFQTKFKTDKYMGEAIIPRGEKSANALSVWSNIIKAVLDLASPVIDRPRWRDIQITRAIRKSIKKSNVSRPLQLVDDLFNSPSLAKDINKKKFAKLIGGALNNEGRVVMPSGTKVGGFSSDNITVDTTKLTSKTGQGYKDYKAIWDTGEPYKAEALSDENKWRLPINFLKYLDEGNPTSHIIIPRGVEGGLGLEGEKLTKTTGKRLAQGLLKKIEALGQTEGFDTAGTHISDANIALIKKLARHKTK